MLSPHVVNLNPGGDLQRRGRGTGSANLPAADAPKPGVAAALPPRSPAAPRDPGPTTPAWGRAAPSDPVPTARDPPARKSPSYRRRDPGCGQGRVPRVCPAASDDSSIPRAPRAWCSPASSRHGAELGRAAAPRAVGESGRWRLSGPSRAAGLPTEVQLRGKAELGRAHLALL